MTKSEVKYLSTMYFLGANDKPVQISEIAKNMGYSKPSVYYAMENLQIKNFVTKVEKKYMLTNCGKKVVKKYENCILFMENFLIKKLDCNKNIAKKDSLSLVCSLSDDTFCKLENVIKRS